MMDSLRSIKGLFKYQATRLHVQNAWGPNNLNIAAFLYTKLFLDAFVENKVENPD